MKLMQQLRNLPNDYTDTVVIAAHEACLQLGHDNPRYQALA